MNDDELMAALRDAKARDDAADPLNDEGWMALAEKLAAGTLTEAERRTLEAMAAKDARVAEAVAALAPLGAPFEARVVARIDAARGEAPAAHGGKVLAFRRRALGIAGALAVAAAIALVMARGGSGRRDDGEPLPAYALVVTGGQKDVRSGDAPAPGDVIRVAPDSPLSLVLRPARSVKGELEVRALLVEGGETRPWSPPYKVSPSGVVQITGAAQGLLPSDRFPASGSAETRPIEAVVAVGRALPEDPREILSVSSLPPAPADRPIQVVRAHLLLVGR